MKSLIMTTLLCLIWISLSSLPFQDGEKLEFSVKYGLVTAAEASLEVNSADFQGMPVWYLKITARTHNFFDPFFKVRDKIESWWSKTTLLPLKFSKNLQEGTYRQYRVHYYDHRNLTTNYQKYSFRSNEYVNQDMHLTPNAQDILSAFYYVRTQDLVVGRPIRVNITADGRSMDTKIIVHRIENVNTIFGRKECVVIEPKLAGEAVFKQSGRILIWLTNDAFKIPVKLDSAVTFGSFVATLSKVENVSLRIR